MTTSGITNNASAIASATNANAASDTSKSAVGKSSLAKNFDTFLTMLTTQLKHQDPLSPMDSTQFTNQLVQFAGVEQQINANSNLEKLISTNNINLKAQAISYIGQTVEAPSNQVPLQNGEGNFSYTLPEEAKSVSILIKDSKGTIVRNIPGVTSSGRHEATWDGKDANGKQLTDGAYGIEVAAVNGEGTSITSSVSVYGKVTDVSSDDTGTYLGLGKVVTTVDKVLTVRDTASVQSSSSSTTTN